MNTQSKKGLDIPLYVHSVTNKACAGIYWSKYSVPITNYIKEQLQEPLHPMYDLEVTVPSFGLTYVLSLFSSIPPQKTTVRQYFLQKINDPQTSNLYICQIYNTLATEENSGWFFKDMNDYVTAALCDAADKQYTDLQNNPAPRSQPQPTNKAIACLNTHRCI